jgi:endonuclease YncB( thermonuclease family)
MLAEGHAWYYDRYCTEYFCGKYEKLAENAKKQKLGLWAEKKPKEPWLWRRK